MEIKNLLPTYIPLIDPAYIDKDTTKKDSSLLVTTPEEIERNLQAWRDLKERIHIVV